MAGGEQALSSPLHTPYTDTRHRPGPRGTLGSLRASPWRLRRALQMRARLAAAAAGAEDSADGRRGGWYSGGILEAVVRAVETRGGRGRKTSELRRVRHGELRQAGSTGGGGGSRSSTATTAAAARW